MKSGPRSSSLARFLLIEKYSGSEVNTISFQKEQNEKFIRMAIDENMIWIKMDWGKKWWGQKGLQLLKGDVPLLMNPLNIVIAPA